MAPRYTPEQLLFLRDSPLVKKPDNLPPSDEWMGPVPDSNGRAQAGRKEASDRHSKGDGPLFDQTNRRTASDRHSRGSANPEDIILGPPKTAFTSSTSIRNANKSLDISERPAKDGESSRRFTLNKLGDAENDRAPGRDGRRMRRGDGDQDTEGWSTVKPRKSFGAEGAERMFNGRMGGERHKDDRRTRENHDRDHKDRPARGFENYSRDKEFEHDHEDSPRRERNGVGRGRNEPTWFKDKEEPPPSGRNGNGNRHVDSNRGWREKDRDDGERGERGERGDRRWNRDKDQRQERSPEWMAEASDEKKHTHTMEDFEKWKKSMKASNGDTPADEGPSKNAKDNGNGFEPGSFFGPETPKVDTPLGIDTGPDKFFGQWAADKKETGSGDPQQDEGVVKAKPAGKASRFKSFFAAPPSEEPMRRVTEPTPTKESAPKGDFQSLFGSKPESSSEDKEAFAALLQKLHSQSIAAPHSTPPANTNPPPPPVSHEARPQSATVHQMPDSFSPYQPERQEEQRHSNARNSQQQLIDLINPKPVLQAQQSSHSSAPRPEQMLQEMINQRRGSSSQPSGRSEQVRDPNSDFMLSLMQGQRAPVQQSMLSRRESQGPTNAERQLRQMEHDVLLANQQQQQYDRELREQREQRVERERRAALQAQRQVRKQQDIPPGFFDEQMMQASYPQQIEQRNARSQQPTQILQRPPGLDNGMPPNWGGPSQQSNQLLPQVQQPRHIQPPPGLPGAPNVMIPMGMPLNMQNLNQTMQIAPSGFPPGFPPGMSGGFEGPNSVMQRGGPVPPLPPPGFFPPPPGFMQQQQQQQQHGRGMSGHGGYDAINGGNGVAFLQGQMFDGRPAQGQGQGPPYRR